MCIAIVNESTFILNFQLFVYLTAYYNSRIIMQLMVDMQPNTDSEGSESFEASLHKNFIQGEE